MHHLSYLVVAFHQISVDVRCEHYRWLFWAVTYLIVCILWGYSTWSDNPKQSRRWQHVLKLLFADWLKDLTWLCMSFKPPGPCREAERGCREKDKWSMFFFLPLPPSLCGLGSSRQTGCGCNSCWAEGFVWWKQQSAAKEDCFAALLQADLKLSQNASDESWIIDWPAMSVSFCSMLGGLYHANQVLGPVSSYWTWCLFS